MIMGPGELARSQEHRWIRASYGVYGASTGELAESCGYGSYLGFGCDRVLASGPDPAQASKPPVQVSLPFIESTYQLPLDAPIRFLAAECKMRATQLLLRVLGGTCARAPAFCPA